MTPGIQPPWEIFEHWVWMETHKTKMEILSQHGSAELIKLWGEFTRDYNTLTNFPSVTRSAK